jgi:hypothetical protein
MDLGANRILFLSGDVLWDLLLQIVDGAQIWVVLKRRALGCQL